MSLTALPVELTRNIAECLDPISCFDFSLTSRYHWSACDELVRKHARLYVEYRCIDADRTINAGTYLWTKLKEILQDPYLGWYVRELNLPLDRRLYWDEEIECDLDLTPESQRPPEEDLQIFQSAVDILGPMYPEIIYPKILYPGIYPDDNLTRCLEHDLRIGSDEGIITILVHYLPLLKTFRLTNKNVLSSLEMLLEQVAIAYGDKARTPGLPFQRLESVAIASSNGFCRPTWVLKFVSIPSVKNFVGQAIGDLGGGPFWDRALKLPLSNIKELLFDRCKIDVGSVEKILSRIEALERFSYQVEHVAWVPFEPTKIMEALIKYQAHSLEHLYLESFPYGEDEDYELCPLNSDMFCLRECEKLKSLRCRWMDIFHWEQYKDEPLEDSFHTEEEERPLNVDLAAALPQSLEALHLIDPFPGDGDMPEVLGVRVISTFRNRGGALPNLKWLCIDREYHDMGNRMGGGPVQHPAMRELSENPLVRLVEGHGGYI